MGDPAVHADQALARKVGRRFAELEKIVKAHKRWQQLGQDLEDTKELAEEDADFAAEIPGLEASYEEASELLHRLLIPRDPDDARNVILKSKVAKVARKQPYLLPTWPECTCDMPSIRVGNRDHFGHRIRSGRL